MSDNIVTIFDIIIKYFGVYFSFKHLVSINVDSSKN